MVNPGHPHLLVSSMSFLHSIHPTMPASDDINRAFEYVRANPNASVRAAAKNFQVPRSTLGARVNGTHAAPGQRARRHLSKAQETALVNVILHYGECHAPTAR